MVDYLLHTDDEIIYLLLILRTVLIVSIVQQVRDTSTILAK